MGKVVKDYKSLSVQEEASFILMVLLDDGKSNLPYRLLCCLAGVRAANKYYFRKLFEGHRLLNYAYYRDKFEKEQRVYCK